MKKLDGSVFGLLVQFFKQTLQLLPVTIFASLASYFVFFELVGLPTTSSLNSNGQSGQTTEKLLQAGSFVFTISALYITLAAGFSLWIAHRMADIAKHTERASSLISRQQVLMVDQPDMLASTIESIALAAYDWLASSADTSTAPPVPGGSPASPNNSPMAKLLILQGEIIQLQQSLRNLDTFRFVFRYAVANGSEREKIIECLTETDFGSRALGVIRVTQQDGALRKAVEEGENSFRRASENLRDTITRLQTQTEDSEEIYGKIYDYLEQLRTMNRVMPGSVDDMQELQKFFLVAEANAEAVVSASPSTSVQQAKAYAHVARRKHGVRGGVARLRRWRRSRWRSRSR